MFLPDSVAHRLWVHENVDMFLATSASSAAAIRRYWPEAKVRVVDAPVGARFGAPLSRRRPECRWVFSPTVDPS